MTDATKRWSAIAATMLWATGCDVVFGLALQGPGDAQQGDAPSQLACPSTYTRVGPGWYRVGQQAVTWDQARTACRDDASMARGDGDADGRTHLAVLGSHAEMDVIDEAADLIWFGFVDRRIEGQFEWITDEVITPAFPPQDGFPWIDGEPNDANGTEDCAAMSVHDRRLNDLSCETTMPYVCECDAYAERVDIP